MPKEDNLCVCSGCGCKWVRGRDGGHSCSAVSQDKLEKLTRAICIYAREEMGSLGFENDNDVLNYFDKFAREHDYQ